MPDTALKTWEEHWKYKQEISKIDYYFLLKNRQLKMSHN